VEAIVRESGLESRHGTWRKYVVVATLQFEMYFPSERVSSIAG
jgi:hypothetical protein